jgi:hypothetical protein
MHQALGYYGFTTLLSVAENFLFLILVPLSHLLALTAAVSYILLSPLLLYPYVEN